MPLALDTPDATPPDSSNITKYLKPTTEQVYRLKSCPFENLPDSLTYNKKPLSIYYSSLTKEPSPFEIIRDAMDYFNLESSINVLGGNTSVRVRDIFRNPSVRVRMRFHF